jgi:hypothetical protein
MNETRTGRNVTMTITILRNQFNMLATVALLLCGAGNRCAVWAVGDSFRIDPTNGKAFEANALVFPIHRVVTTGNPICCGMARETVLLKAPQRDRFIQVIVGAPRTRRSRASMSKSAI